MATVERIYERAATPMTDEGARHNSTTYVSENPRGKHGQVVYDLVGDFGMKPADVRRRFDFYFDQFAIQAEN